MPHPPLPRFGRDPLGDELGMPSISLFGRMPVGQWCHYCKRFAATTRDHIVPRAAGGRDAFWNLVPACLACNEKKDQDPTTCTCLWCARAVRLFNEGHRDQPRAAARAQRKKQLIKWRVIPVEPLPPSFPGST